MSAEPIEHLPAEAAAEPYEVIHLGGEAAAVVPLHDLRRMKALERLASADALEEADAEAMYAQFREWEAAGRPGAMSHEEVTRFLLGEAE
ncbi:hypothetical protein F8568_000395 [Actinomadura sp. LD22]|uniref:Uncharacterized protein n=1 Tax=Actinomadura physcomitrii TaxID=2650748 RepID=A0A6I4M3X2_9ACTN|nr:hypothetical protein [Actinomadura physcomitrii]MVZ98866.1 hypothetical protein [Actinomadura physcomitrii]